MASIPVFTASDAARLMARNLMQSAGRRRREISSSLMHSEDSSSSGGSTDSAIETSLSFIVPEFIESQETLEYIGWGEEKAAKIWADWEAGKLEETEINADELQEYFLEYTLSAIPTIDLEDTDWGVEMLSWGVAKELVDAIMDDEFANIRLTETASFWVRDTMEIRFLSLERLRQESEMRSRTPTISIPTTQDREAPRVMTEIAEFSTVPGKLTLYKAITTDRIRYDSANNLSVSSLVSSTPSDFRGYLGSTLHFTPTLAVAKHYAKYTRRRANSGKPVILELALANSFIEGLPPYVLQFGELWKQVIFLSRTGHLLEGDLKRIHSLPLIIAPTSHTSNKDFGKMKGYHEISESHVLYVEDQEAIQYVFQKDETLYSLKDHGLIRIVGTDMWIPLVL